MGVLALDLGTSAGWAFGADTENTISGVISLKQGRYAGGGMRFVRFEQALNDLASVRKIDQVVFEEVRAHAGTDAAHVYGGLLATLTKWCEERSIPYEGWPVGTIKKAWTGKGNAPKAAMIAEARRRGFDVTDDNEADAIALLHCALEGHGG